MFVLDGGLPAWEAAGGVVDTSPVGHRVIDAPAAALLRAEQAQDASSRYQARLQVAEVRDWTDMVRILGSGTEQIVDARPLAK